MIKNPIREKAQLAASPGGGRRRRLLDESFYRNTFEQCPIGMIILGLDQRILDFNAYLRAMLEYSDDDIAGRALLDLVHPDDAKATAREIGRVCSSEIGSVKLEARLLKKKGGWFWANLSTALIRVDREEALQVIAVVEDITSRKTIEADLIRSNTDLELYASIAAHDLQEPVRKVLTYGEILAKMSECLPPEGETALERSRHAALRMKELIEDLLEYARVNAVKRASAPVDLNVVLKEVLADLEISIAERSGQVEVGRLPVVNADALQMRQLFQNLISNAVKFTERGQPPHVTVSAELLGGKEVRIEVKDEGIGFDEKFLDRIFRPFQRVCDRNVYEGSGIGLAICKSVVQRHGGSITAASAPGKGACFKVVLPIRPR